jgi:hypothetical protein
VDSCFTLFGAQQHCVTGDELPHLRNLSCPQFLLFELSFTVDAMEVLKILHESFPQVDQFIRIQISFYFLCVSYWTIGSETKSNWLI